jgi:hypothetical protein
MDMPTENIEVGNEQDTPVLRRDRLFQRTSLAAKSKYFEQRPKVVAINGAGGFKLIAHCATEQGGSVKYKSPLNVAGQVHVKKSKRPHLKAD